jgi:hypothetical protein
MTKYQADKIFNLEREGYEFVGPVVLDKNVGAVMLVKDTNGKQWTINSTGAMAHYTEQKK